MLDGSMKGEKNALSKMKTALKNMLDKTAAKEDAFAD